MLVDKNIKMKFALLLTKNKTSNANEAVFRYGIIKFVEYFLLAIAGVVRGWRKSLETQYLLRILFVQTTLLKQESTEN